MNAYVNGSSEGFSQSEFEDVKLCLETLLSIRAGSQPLDRNIGINYDGIVGYPAEVAKNKLSLEIYEKVGIYEPRVEIEKIEFEETANGLVPHIYFVKA